MDEAAKLVSELQQKLTELDQKVWQYRRDMTSEFEKYEESLLRGVPKDVSETVSKTIAESKKGCRSLYPGGAWSIESLSSGTGRANGAGRSQSGTAPIAAASQRRATDMADESPKSPQHEREKEFQGLFTPSYLPLLDSTTRNERRSSPDPPLSPRQNLKGKEKEMDDSKADATEDTSSSSSTATPEPKRPYTPKRRNTDSFSIASDWSGSGSDSTPRRSALRRSSSSKGHRVRFDVMGEEVLPTASPRSFRPIIPDTIYPHAYPDSDEEKQIEDVEEPPPKRISSSQRLRALSRSPLAEDGTKWTTVMAPPDGSASVATNGIQTSDDEDEQLEIGGRSKASVAKAPSDKSSISKALGSPPSDDSEAVALGENKEEEQAETPSDDEMLDMPPLRRQSASPASMLSPAIPQDISGNKSPTASTRSPGKPLHSLETTGSIPQTTGSQFSEEYDHDDLFHFDDGDVDGQKNPPPRKEEEDDEASSSDETARDDTPSSPLKEPEPTKLSPYSTSPARDIVRSNHRAKSEETPASKGIVGSYKGRPFSIPIVSPEVHAMAASLGEVNSFVGSVHGRTGLDESDAQSFRASLRNSGTPRSLSERMRMEDIMEAEEQKRKGS